VEKLQEKIRRKNCCQPALAAMKPGMPNRDESLTLSVAKSTVPLQIKLNRQPFPLGINIVFSEDGEREWAKYILNLLSLLCLLITRELRRLS
jgi:hypothetical protein